MNILSSALKNRRAMALTTCGLAASVLLSGCYVVPMQTLPPAGAAPVAAPGPVVAQRLNAHLYPSNETARTYGAVAGLVSSDLQGRGTFTAQIGGENFSGEATRKGKSRDGIANGAGDRGSYLQCTYSMNSLVQGIGSCQLSNGATFTMHLSQ